MSFLLELLGVGFLLQVSVLDELLDVVRTTASKAA